MAPDAGVQSGGLCTRARQRLVRFWPARRDELLALFDRKPTRRGSDYGDLCSLERADATYFAKSGKSGFRAPVAYDGTVDETPQVFDLGGVRFSANMVYPWVPKDIQTVAQHGGMIIQTGKDEFIVAGTGITLRFSDPDGKDQIGMEQVVEGHFENGRFIEGRWLNGDEIHQGRQLQIPPDQTLVLRLRLYRYR